eukprot:TRINITY_DN10605_c0_g2_i1.p1 TRINITY_DN10605_c0_g2~~TRINITY_DN10605_c0_g2_i1.p1  ORF type:complete len:526 (+),score=175.08 TRINITY_DN10605_c0_g2_i1:102-1679(+)
MSLQQVVEEQKKIVAEQQAIRADLQNLQRKIDASLRNDLQRIVSRIEANEGRIQKLSGGLGASRGGGSRTPSEASRPGSTAGGYNAAPAARSMPAMRAPQAPRSPAMPSGPASSSASPFGGGDKIPRDRPVRKREEELQDVKQALTSAVRSQPASNVWEEPAEAKVAPSSVDRFEQQLKMALERSREFQRYQNNPIQAVQAIFNKLDKNHSGKVDPAELATICKVLEFQSDPKSLSALFARYDVDHSGVLTIEEFCRSMFKLDGDTEFKAKSAIARMREVLSLRAGGFESVKAMASQFRIIDRDRTGQLTKEEFNISLDVLFAAYNVKFTQAERNALFQQFDFDKSGTVDYNEFLRGIRGDMSDFRLDWVKQAFAILDKDGSGIVDANELAGTYDVSQNPAVQSGKVSPEDALNMFMKHYDANADGRVTLEEFIENYQWVSASITNDDYFELMMRNAWHITGGEGWCQNTSNLRVLVKHTRSPDEVVEVTHDLGLPRDPDMKYQEVVKRLTQQGVKDIAKIEFFG